jgi:hypothetical protein
MGNPTFKGKDSITISLDAGDKLAVTLASIAEERPTSEILREALDVYMRGKYGPTPGVLLAEQLLTASKAAATV